MKVEKNVFSILILGFQSLSKNAWTIFDFQKKVKITAS
jgi:hypothetical protein